MDAAGTVGAADRVGAGSDGGPAVVVLQRRVLRALVAGQILGGLGQAAGAAAGALLATGMTGSSAAAGLPLALLVAGSAAAAVPVSALSHRAGRRIGLTLALTTGAAGALVVLAGAVVGSLGWVLVGHALLGAGNTAVMLARYAAADLAAAGARGRAIGLLVSATTFGAVLGPNLLGPAAGPAGLLGLPGPAGLYLVAATAYGAAAVLLALRLRPDPLLTARRLAASTATGWATPIGAAEVSTGPPVPGPVRRLLIAPRTAGGLVSVTAANAVMVAVMAVAPVHLGGHGHGLGPVGLVISLHVGAMFAPAPLSGWCTDRAGPLPVAVSGTLLLLVSAPLTAAAGGNLLLAGAGLVLLGLGWNGCLVAGSALLTEALSAADRLRAESVGEVSTGVAAAGGSSAAGVLVATAGFTWSAVGAAVVALALLAFLLVIAVRAPGGGRTPR